jgi:hypothetical protein
MVVRKTANNYSERMSRAWHTHGNSTTIENGERDPSGGERLRVFCRGCLGAVDGGGVWFDNITLELLHETAHACLSRPLRHSSPGETPLFGQCESGPFPPACWSRFRLALRLER